MDIKELATLTAAEMDDIYLRNVPANILEQYATRLIAAYTEEQEPVSLYPCGFKELRSLVIKSGAYLARGMDEGEPVTESIRSAAMVLVGYAKDMSDLLARQPLFTAPPEPAPQTDGSTTVSAPDQERMSRSACAAIVFSWPDKCSVSANIDASIDAAMGEKADAIRGLA